MTIFQVHLRERPIDGWGTSLPEKERIIGTYSDRQKAQAHVEKISADPNWMYCAIGKPRIVEVNVE